MIAGGCAALAWGAVGAHIGGALPAGATVGAGALVGGAFAGALTAGVVNPGLGWFGPAVSRGADDAPLVSLTFDDGPHPDSTPALLDALRKAGAKATFFVLADRAARYPELLRAIAAEHEVGLHGLGHHPWLTFWSIGRGAAELSEALRQLDGLGASDVRWYRPPFGVTSPRLVRASARAGLTTIWCSLRTHDGTLADRGRLRRRCAEARPGDILLLHEGPGRPAADAMGAILGDLSARGLRSVTVGALLNP